MRLTDEVIEPDKWGIRNSLGSLSGDLHVGPHMTIAWNRGFESS